MTEFEKVIKYSLLSPLKDKDRAAHKLGSLNEAKVRTVMNAVVDGIGYELVDMKEVGQNQRDRTHYNIYTACHTHYNIYTRRHYQLWARN